MAATNIITIIVIILVILVIIFFIQKDAFNQTSLTSGLLDATKKTVVAADNIKVGDDGTVNYTWSVWIYISDWSYRLGEDKVIMRRGTKKDACPLLSLGGTENTLTIKQSIHLDNDEYGYDSIPTSIDGSNQVCTIPNIPIQKWVCITVTLNGRDMDTYINGKLVKTCVLDNVAHVDPNADLFITPGGGFQGNVSNVNYWASPISPQQAWNIYKHGPTGSSLSDLFAKYQLKFVFLSNGVEQNEFTI